MIHKDNDRTRIIHGTSSSALHESEDRKKDQTDLNLHNSEPFMNEENGINASTPGIRDAETQY